MSDSAAAKQRLLSIHVGEVSLVGNPANEIEFLVAKGLAGLTGDAAVEALEALIAKHKVDAPTAAKLRDTIKTRQPEATTTMGDSTNVNKAGGGFTLDAYTATTVTMNAIQSKTWDIQEKLREGKIDEATKLITEVNTMLSSAAEMSAQINKHLDDVASGITALVAGVTKAVDGKKQKLPPEMMDKLKALADNIVKMVAEDGDDAAVAKAANAILIEDGQLVVKGKAQFSAERLGNLKASLASLAGMVRDADPAGYSEWHTGIAPVAAAAAPAAPAADVAKSADPNLAAIQKSLGELVGVTKGLVDRVAAVEKANATSKELPAEGTQNVTKTGGSMWGSVFSG